MGAGPAGLTGVPTGGTRVHDVGAWVWRAPRGADTVGESNRGGPQTRPPCPARALRRSPPAAGTVHVWSRVSGSRLALLLKGLLLVGLVGGLTAFVVADKTVTLEIDGEAASVRTYAATVGDLLADQGLALSGHDVVAPALDTPLGEGQLVAVAYGRPITLWVDGEKTQAWTTARTVGDAVQAIGLRAEGAWFSVSRSARLPREGFDVALRMPKAVAVVADGARRDLVTTAPSVADVLTEAGVAVGASDEVSADLRSAPTAGLVVTVTRVAAGQDVIQVPVPFAEVRQDDATLLVGSTKVAREGVAGVATETYATALRDGAVVSKTLVSRVVSTAPVDRLVLVGTKPVPPAPSRPKPAAPAPERRRRHPGVGPGAQLGGPRPLRVRGQPAGDRRRRQVLRPLPVHPRRVGERGGHRQPDRRLRVGADLPRATAVHGPRRLAVGHLRLPPVQLS